MFYSKRYAKACVDVLRASKQVFRIQFDHVGDSFVVAHVFVGRVVTKGKVPVVPGVWGMCKGSLTDVFVGREERVPGISDDEDEAGLGIGGDEVEISFVVVGMEEWVRMAEAFSVQIVERFDEKVRTTFGNACVVEF